MINDITKPLVFVGSSAIIHVMVQTCENIGYTIAGIIDDDYHGQGHFQDIPVIAKEEDLSKPIWNDYQFFCATNWQPEETTGPWHVRNREKRSRLIDLLENNNLNIATIVHGFSSVYKKGTTIGKGVYIDALAYIGPFCTIGDWTNIWQGAGIAHNNVVGRNCVVQRQAIISGGVKLGNDVYLGLHSVVNRDDVFISDNTFVHPHVMLLRGTQPNEVVSIAGKDLRKVYSHPTVE